MTLNKIYEDIGELIKQGYGECEGVMFENLALFDKGSYHTIIESIEMRKATFDKDKDKDVAVFIR